MDAAQIWSLRKGGGKSGVEETVEMEMREHWSRVQVCLQGSSLTIYPTPSTRIINADYVVRRHTGT